VNRTVARKGAASRIVRSDLRQGNFQSGGNDASATRGEGRFERFDRPSKLYFRAPFRQWILCGDNVFWLDFFPSTKFDGTQRGGPEIAGTDRAKRKVGPGPYCRQRAMADSVIHHRRFCRPVWIVAYILRYRSADVHVRPAILFSPCLAYPTVAIPGHTRMWPQRSDPEHTVGCWCSRTSTHAPKECFKPEMFLRSVKILTSKATTGRGAAVIAIIYEGDPPLSGGCANKDEKRPIELGQSTSGLTNGKHGRGPAQGFCSGEPCGWTKGVSLHRPAAWAFEALKRSPQAADNGTGFAFPLPGPSRPWVRPYLFS